MAWVTRQPVDLLSWVAPGSASLLDVGCNVGALLASVEGRLADASLVGVDMNRAAIGQASRRHPGISFVHGDICDLPFEDGTFDTLFCLEVLEHVQESRRADALGEMRRVTRRGGRLILSTPHDGWFAWLDANNIRFRFPAIHAAVLRKGIKDAAYEESQLPVVEHKHFRAEELLELGRPGWRSHAVVYSGCFVAPLVDWLRWPFYRTRRASHPLSRRLEALGAWDHRHDYGRASWRIWVVFEAA